MAETTKKTTEKVAETKVDMEEKVLIELPISEGNDEDVFVSVNGNSFLIQRGVPVEVPSYVKEVLDNKVAMEKLAYERKTHRTKNIL